MDMQDREAKGQEIKSELEKIEAFMQHMGPRTDQYYFAYVTALQLCREQANLFEMDIRVFMTLHNINVPPPELESLHAMLVETGKGIIDQRKMPKVW